MEKLVFEGAGWSGSDSSGDVGNCRIRTRIRNRQGRCIYLEMIGFVWQGKHVPTWAQGLEIVGHVDACFYTDSPWDKNRSRSAALAPVENMRFEYNKSTILQLVNTYLDCDFDVMEVVNEGLHVFRTEEPLADCSLPGYTPYTEQPINISTLDGVPRMGNSTNGINTFPIRREFAWRLKAMRDWAEGCPLANATDYFAKIYHHSETGDIYALYISNSDSRSPHISLGREELMPTIDEIKQTAAL